MVVRFAISVTAAPLSVVHHTVDLDNASCGLTLSCGSARYGGRVLMNQPTPGSVKPGMSSIARKRWAPRPVLPTPCLPLPAVVCAANGRSVTLR